MSERRAQHGRGRRAAERAEPLDAGEGDAPVRLVGCEQPFEGGDEGGRRLGGAQRGEQPDGVQGVGGAQPVGGEGGSGPCGARVAEPAQGVRGGDTALRVAVVEQQHQGFEGAPVAGAAEPEGRDLPCPQGPFACDEDGGEFLGVVGGQQVLAGG
ncbi:hypothetical protein GCM10023082_59050 [Streptomyces tremellae]|uniref:Uncharacterized protein n=1 Tax=Streptomyces tremellae TaxID=1124239 RepID=A0ABP7G7Y4_9ACTN